MDSYTTNYLYEIINKCTQSEFSQASLSQIKLAHTSLGLKSSNKKKDDLISDIYRFLSNILVRQGNPTQVRDGFPLFNHNNELFQRNPAVQHLIDNCNQKIHIANIHLAQINYSRLNQVKKALNIAEGQSSCICNQPVDSNFSTETMVKCINPKCGRVLHKACMKIAPEDDEYPFFECPDCVLFKCDPLHEVIKILVQPFVVDNQPREFKIDEMIFREIKINEMLGVEFRVIRLEEKSHEHCWPHQGELEINQAKHMEFKPLQQNSALKKRKDERLFTSDVNSGSNYIQLKYTQGSDPRNSALEETYIAAVYLVKKLTCEELLKRIKNDNRRSIEDCKKSITEGFVDSMIDIDRVVCPLTCVYDIQPLKTPAKGAHCKHPSCFSLENYINLWQKNGQRKWTCPICKAKAYDIIVDSYFEQIVEEAGRTRLEGTKPAEVAILKTGEYQFLKNEAATVENDEDKKIEVKIEKPVEKGSNSVIVLDDSDEEDDLRNVAPTNNIEAMVSEKPAQGVEKEENKNTDMDIEKESVKDKQPEDGIKSQEQLNNEKEMVLEDTTPQEKTQKNKEIEAIDIEDDEDRKPVANEEDNGNEPSDNQVDGRKEARDLDDPNENESIEEVSNSRELERPDKQNDNTSSKQSQRNGQSQQSSKQSVLDQFQQLQASEEYKLQQQRQYQQQQQRMQLINDALSMSNLNMGLHGLQGLQGIQSLQGLQGLQSLQGLQGLQGLNAASLLGGFGNNVNLFQQTNNALPSLLANNLKNKLQQQQAGRGSVEELASLLLGDMTYKANYGADLNNPFNSLIRNLSDLSTLQQTMRLNGLANLAGMNGMGVSPLEALLQNKNNDLSFVLRNGNSPLQNLINSNMKSNNNGQDNLEGEGNSPAQEEEEAIQNLPPPAIGVLDRDPNRPKVFQIDREEPKKRVLSDAEKNLEKMMDLSEKKLTLPTFENFRQIEQSEAKKGKEPNLQKNKKLVALVMKQFPLQLRPVIKPGKPADGQDMVPEQSVATPTTTTNHVTNPVSIVIPNLNINANSNTNSNGPMDAEEKDQPPQVNSKAQGQESDPICLE